MEYYVTKSSEGKGKGGLSLGGTPETFAWGRVPDDVWS